MTNEVEDRRAAERQQREDTKLLLDGTLDVMRELVHSVRSQHDSFTSYLRLFTSASAPLVRETSDSALHDFETKVGRKHFSSTHAPDPFAFLLDSPFDPSDPGTLSDIKASIGGIQ